MVKFIHTADLHLDSPFKGLTYLPMDLLNLVKEASFHSFETIVNQAIDSEVDFVLVAGDLFDLESRSISAQNFIAKCFIALEKENIPVYLVYGNHDYVTDQRLFIDFPDNVHVFGPDVESKTLTTKAGEKIAITGFSYHSQHIKENKLTDFPAKSSQVDYHIGLYHGDLASQSEDYAPFNLSDMEGLHYDYFALGHIHKRHRLSDQVPAYYSGNIQGRHINEPGPKGSLLVELSAHNHQVSFVESSDIIWDQVQLTVDGQDSLSSLKDKLLKNLDLEKELNLVQVELSLNNEDNLALVSDLTAQDLTTLVDKDNVWVTKLSVQTLQKLTPIQKAYPKSFETAANKVIEDKMPDYLADLQKNIDPQFLQTFKTKDKQEEIIKTASEKMNLMDH